MQPLLDILLTSLRAGGRISSSTTPFPVGNTNFDLWVAIILLSSRHLLSRMEPQPFSSLWQKIVSAISQHLDPSSGFEYHCFAKISH
jgi:hypothetical protein